MKTNFFPLKTLGLLILFAVSLKSVQGEEPSVVLLVHGIRSGGNPANQDLYSYQAFRDWGNTHLGKAKLIDFNWAINGDADSANQASIRVGQRTDLVSGMSNRAWRGSDRLIDAIATVRGKIGPKARLSIVAHSQGTVLTLRALQDLEGNHHVDNVVFMGSPLFERIIEQGNDNTRMSDAMQRVQGTLLNISSPQDDVLNRTLAALRTTPGGCIGSRGLPRNIRNLGQATQHEHLLEWTIEKKRILSIELRGIDHFGNDGWWALNWLTHPEDAHWPARFPASEFEKLLKSETPVPESAQLPALME